MITLDNPLILGYTKDGYKVSHPNIDKAELVSAEYARQLKAQRDELLEALKNIVSANGVGYISAEQFVKDLQLLIPDAKKAIENCK